MSGSQLGNQDIVIGNDSFTKRAKAYIINHFPVDGYSCCPCVDCRYQEQFQNVEKIRFLKNYRISNKHGEVGDNKPNEPSRDTVKERTGQTIDTGMVGEVVVDDEPGPKHIVEDQREIISRSMHDTLVDDSVLDDLDMVIRDAEL